MSHHGLTLTPEQERIRDAATAMGREIKQDAVAWDRADLAPCRDICDRAREAGLLGITMPKEYGGRGGTALDYAIGVEAVLRASQSWFGPEPLFWTSGPGASMLLLGDELVAKKYLPHVVTGELGVAIALTEPNHGSDLTLLETTAVRDGDHFIINGKKSFITGSGVNELYATFVRMDDIPGPRGVAAIVIEADLPGVTSAKGPEFIGDRGLPHGEIEYVDVRVPAENLIMGPGHFPRLMAAFNMERLHNSALTLAISEAAYDEAVAFVGSRESFGRPIIEFQSVYHDLVNMWTKIEAQRMLVHRAGQTATDGIFPDAHDVTVAKLHGATIMGEITMKALELHGGYGVTTDYPIQRIHRDAISSIVAGGAPAVLRNSIAQMIFPDRKFSQVRG